MVHSACDTINHLARMNKRMDIRRKQLITTQRVDAYFTNAKTLQQHNFLLESLQFLHQESDQS